MFVFAAAALAASAAHAAPVPEFPAVDDTSFVEATGDRVLQLSADIPAPPAEVWKAWSTPEGWKRLDVPFALVDFRVGGIIETNYKADAVPGARENIRNQILAYVPERMLAIRNVQAPPTFKHPEEFGQTATVIELESAGKGGTHLRLTAVGYRSGAAFDELLAQFRWGNAYTIDKLRRSYSGEAAGKAKPELSKFNSKGGQ